MGKLSARRLVHVLDLFGVILWKIAIELFQMLTSKDLVMTFAVRVAVSLLFFALPTSLPSFQSFVVVPSIGDLRGNPVGNRDSDSGCTFPSQTSASSSATGLFHVSLPFHFGISPPYFLIWGKLVRALKFHVPVLISLHHSQSPSSVSPFPFPTSRTFHFIVSSSFHLSRSLHQNFFYSSWHPFPPALFFLFSPTLYHVLMCNFNTPLDGHKTMLVYLVTFKMEDGLRLSK